MSRILRKRLVYRLFPFNMDEVDVVHDVIGNQPGTMLDVGAHFGNSLAPFEKDGWTVYAFEPDQANRALLTSRHPAAAGRSARDFGNRRREGVLVHQRRVDGHQHSLTLPPLARSDHRSEEHTSELQSRM